MNARSLSAALSIVSLSTSAGTFSFINVTSEEDTQIAPARTYTHLVDFGANANAATINGVVFTAKGPVGNNYELKNTGGSFVNNTSGGFAGTGGLGDLLSDFYYGGDAGGVQTLTLTGLREAHTYVISFVVAGWGTPAVDFTVSDAPGVVTRLARDGTSSGPDADNQLPTEAGRPAALINYEYVAPASGSITFTLDAVSAGDTFHHYGFVNQLTGLPNDSDADGIANIYETANGLNPNARDADLDLDKDGLSNLAEYNLGTKANNPDTDGDGLSDGVETNSGTYVSATKTGTSPLLADTDGDGLSDGAENNSGTFVNLEKTGTNPLMADTDGDGFDDGVEANGGFDPALATSTPESSTSIRTAVEFRFNAAKNVSYRIETSTDLGQAVWTTLEPTIPGTGGPITRFYSIENQSVRFYRAKRN